MRQEEINAFMEYLKEEFPECLEKHFTYDLVINLVKWAYDHHGHSKGSARYIICSIIPELEHEEAEKYLPDFKQVDY